MECKKCGYIMDEFTMECPRCKRLASERPQQTAQPPQVPQPQRGTVPPQRRVATPAPARHGTSPILLGGIILGVLLLGGAGWWFFYDHSESPVVRQQQPPAGPVTVIHAPTDSGIVFDMQNYPAGSAEQQQQQQQQSPASSSGNGVSLDGKYDKFTIGKTTYNDAVAIIGAEGMRDNSSSSQEDVTVNGVKQPQPKETVYLWRGKKGQYLELTFGEDGKLSSKSLAGQ